MNVTKFDIHYLHNEEWFRYYTEFRALAEKTGADELKISALFAQFIVNLDKADLLLEILRKSPLTEKLVNADKDRDNAYRGLRDAVRGFLNYPDDGMQEAARGLTPLIDKYKGILSGNYAEETAAIDNLLQDLQGETPGTSAFTRYVALLGLSAWVNYLTNANYIFKQLLDQRYDNATEKPEGQLKKLRPVLDRFYTAMTNVLNSELLAAGYDDDGINANSETPAPGIAGIYNFVKELNLRAKTYKALVAARKTRNKKDGAAGGSVEGENAITE